MKLQSGFALLDVKHGRKALAKAIERGEKFQVTITGTIESQWGHDDGESIEFEVLVDKVEVAR